MTVSSTTNRKAFTGDAVTASFGTSPVVFFNASELVVQVVVTATGATTTLVENTDYTVSGGAGTTGTVDLAGGSSPYGAPAATETLVIRRVLPFTQTDDFVNNDINDAEVLEDNLDRSVMLMQQLAESQDRALKLSSTEAGTAALTELPFDRANKYLAFDSSKNPIAAGSTDTFPLSIGTGDAVSIYTATTGQYVDWRKGTAASPDTTHGAVLKVSRTTNIAKPGSADLGEEMAAIMGVTTGTTANEAQTVGIYGGAKSNYPLVPTNVQGDACAIYGTARAANYGTAMGAFLNGRRDSANGNCLGAELHSGNWGGAAATYNSTGFSKAQGAWINAGGNAGSAAGICLGNGFGYQFEVGLAFNGQVNGAKTGPVSGVCIRDDSAATTFMDIRGTHTNGIILRSGAGNMVIGGSAAVANYKLFIGANADSGSNSTPLVLRANSVTQSADLFRIENSDGTSHFTLSGTGTLASLTSSGLFTQGRYSADANGGTHDLQKSRNATVGSHTIVQASDILGAVRWGGSDGSAFVVGSQIFSTVEGAPASGNIRSTLDFSTRGADGLVSRMRIKSDGDIYLRSVGSEMATTATLGYPHMPTTNGATTGVPANLLTGVLPFIYDRSNNKIGVYNGGWKWTAALA